MAGTPFGDVLRQLRKWINLRTASDLTDDDLIERFVSRRDEQAFEAIVRRHGPLVLGVCRRLLFDAQDVEDAFQATFLVLVRKAEAIRRRAQLANWLYGVALRIARRARAEAARRAARQLPIQDIPAEGPPSEALGGELRGLLDEEVQRLPEKYRVPVLLCYLQGRTNEEAARVLGCSRGTVATRLARARARLRGRLARRGLDPSAGALGTILSGEAAEVAVPEAMRTSTVRLAVQFAAGRATVAPSVSGLMKGVLRDMFLSRCKIVTVVVLLLGLGAGATAFGYRALAGGPSAPQQKDEAKSPAKENGDPKPVLAWQTQTRVQVSKGRVEAIALSPDGKHLAAIGGPGSFDLKTDNDWKELYASMYPKLWDAATGAPKGAFDKWDLKTIRTNTLALAFAPDGKTLVSAATGMAVWDVDKRRTLRFLDDKGGKGSTVYSMVFSPDGKTIAAWQLIANSGGVGIGLASNGGVVVYDVETAEAKQTLRLYRTIRPNLFAPVADGGRLIGAAAFSADGKTLTTADASGAVKVWNVATAKVKSTRTIRTATPLVLAPGGKLAASDATKGAIDIWDLTTGKRQKVLKGPAKKGEKLHLAFSSDGKILASGGVDGTVIVWDVAAGKEVIRLTGHEAAVNSLAFDADGKTLASGDDKGVVQVWVLKEQKSKRE